MVTNSKKLADLIRKRVESCVIVLVKRLRDGCDVVNEIAPEHLEIMTKDPEQWLEHSAHRLGQACIANVNGIH